MRLTALRRTGLAGCPDAQQALQPTSPVELVTERVHMELFAILERQARHQHCIMTQLFLWWRAMPMRTNKRQLAAMRLLCSGGFSATTRATRVHGLTLSPSATPSSRMGWSVPKRSLAAERLHITEGLLVAYPPLCRGVSGAESRPEGPGAFPLQVPAAVGRPPPQWHFSRQSWHQLLRR